MPPSTLRSTLTPSHTPPDPRSTTRRAALNRPGHKQRVGDSASLRQGLSSPVDRILYTPLVHDTAFNFSRGRRKGITAAWRTTSEPNASPARPSHDPRRWRKRNCRSIHSRFRLPPLAHPSPGWNQATQDRLHYTFRCPLPTVSREAGRARGMSTSPPPPHLHPPLSGRSSTTSTPTSWARGNPITLPRCAPTNASTPRGSRSTSLTWLGARGGAYRRKIDRRGGAATLAATLRVWGSATPPTASPTLARSCSLRCPARA